MNNSIETIFEAQQALRYTHALRSPRIRIERLKSLKKVIQQKEEAIYAALKKDLRKSQFESAVAELIFVLGELDFAIRNLRRWTRPQRAGKSLSMFFAKNRIYYEPKGCCLIIAPWNYPFQLCLAPLISSIAAGNLSIVKPSEFSPATSRVISELISEVFSVQEVACFEGGTKVAKNLLSLPFDHIFFTGSPAVGKIVMEAASRHLGSVTLELGGKSPVVIAPDAHLETAAEKIAWGKLLNAGQTCIAPDYVLLPAQLIPEFGRLYREKAEKLFFKNGVIDPEVYVKIIHQGHFQRLKDMVEEAKKAGATLIWEGEFMAAEETITPFVLGNVPPHCRLLQEEIFGPLLPLIGYQHLQDAIHVIQQGAKPLALYLFSHQRRVADLFLSQTSSGGVCINDVLVHVSNPHLPFGGVNTSGQGSSHGFYGFKAFSHERSVMFQRKINFNSLVYPPYKNKNWVLTLLKRIM